MNINKNKKLSNIVLVLSNMAILVGVLLYGYSLFTLMFVYWFENVVIGVFNVFKMLKAERPISKKGGFSMNGKSISSKVAAIPIVMFFIMHYGMFTLIHGIFVFAMFSQYGFNFTSILAGMAIVFTSHTISYITNYIGNEEYKEYSIAELFNAPYKRIIILHITILGGGFIIGITGESLIFLAAFVVFKTVIDLGFHMTEHKNIRITTNINT